MGRSLGVVLADGSALQIRRGAYRRDRRSATGSDAQRHRCAPDSHVSDAGRREAVGRLPRRAGMDLIDLFIGSEGTLGIITQVTLRAVSPAPATALALVPCRSEPAALAFVDALRRASMDTWRTGDPNGIDAAAIEHMDRRSLEILREDGADRRNDVRFPDGHRARAAGSARAAARHDSRRRVRRDSVAVRSCNGRAPCGAVLCAARASMACLTRPSSRSPAIADAPSSSSRSARRCRPGSTSASAARNTTIDGRDREDRRRHDRAVRSVRRDDGGLPTGFGARGLDFAVWGHISDGNVHPNVLPRSYEEVERGTGSDSCNSGVRWRGSAVVRLPSTASVGVAVKQALLRGLYGDEGIEQMRAVKRALDPDWKLAPGVIFPR